MIKSLETKLETFNISGNMQIINSSANQCLIPSTMCYVRKQNNIKNVLLLFEKNCNKY
jgi:hypothetical protein